MELVLASHNRHKKEELSQLLPQHTFLNADQLGVEFSCDENGRSYQENAQLKAESLFKLVNRPVLADDSGLEVSALANRPGIYSARYGQTAGGGTPSSIEQVTALLAELGDCRQRQAFFVCGLALIVDARRKYYVQACLEGEIAARPCGSAGFGYDPIFYLGERSCTLAELSQGEKNQLSHRAQAARLLAQLLSCLPAR